MRFVTFTLREKPVVGILTADQNAVIPLKDTEQLYLNSQTLPDTMQELIEQGDSALDTVRKIIASLDGNCPQIAFEEANFSAPLPQPKRNIFCVGKNYLDHALELAQFKNFDPSVPQVPVFFSKPPSCVIGHKGIVKHHLPLVQKLDYEVELAVIIGKKAFRIQEKDAYDYIFGYTIMNDVTSRDLQAAHGQWFLGKSPDTFAPLGPCIAHKSVIGDAHNLFVKSIINGELRQDSNTKNMMFDIPTIIESLSAVITLEPGDIIATGTPAGVGNGFNPPKLLRPGDEMRLEIEKIGALVNWVER